MKNINYHYKNYEKALNKQKKRYIKRLKEMFKKDYYKVYFLTFTFTNKTLEKTNQKTRLRYIKDFLNKQASEYMLNLDYGKANNREHYHAIILSRYKVILAKEYKYGVLRFYKCHPTYNYVNAKYDSIDKLTNHAFKETTRESKIIYSRKAIKENRAFKKKAESKLNNYQKTDKAKAIKDYYKAKIKEDKDLERKSLDELYEIHNQA